MSRYYNLGFDDTCDILNERKNRQYSLIVADIKDMQFVPLSNCSIAGEFTIMLFGKGLEVAPAMRNKLINDFGLKQFVGVLSASFFLEAMNQILQSRLLKYGRVKVWYDNSGRLIHIDWDYLKRRNFAMVETFRSTFQSVSMRNSHTIRRPKVLVLDDLPTHVEVTSDCEKVRDFLPEDTLMGGVMLRHSEMGAQATSLYATIFRTFCSNQLIYGYSKKDPSYLGEWKMTVSLNDLAGGLASSLGSMLNSIRWLEEQNCLTTEEAIPIIKARWSLAQQTANSMFDMANAYKMGFINRSGGASLYEILNNFTAVTTHQRNQIPEDDCRIIEELTDSLLTPASPLQRLLQQDICPGCQPIRENFDPIPEWSGEDW